jgi:CDP-6-deoxy-D-xylo-4-hexulose-3-dehydrase
MVPLDARWRDLGAWDAVWYLLPKGEQGNPYDFTATRQLIKGRNIVLMEDNCELLETEFEGRKAGTFGVMGSFGSFFLQHISTMEGGLIVTDDEELHHILLCFLAHGWTRNLPKHN